LILNPGAEFPLARALHAPGGAPLGAVFSFVSGLYFRGKATYATAFARPPEDAQAGALVLSAGEGLRSLDERVTASRLASWADVEIDEDNPDFTRPLENDAAALERAHGATTRFLLLGSVATEKYVQPLTRVFGDHLLFPCDFVGRGDMSRGALMLAAVRAGTELVYEPVEAALRWGRRAASVRR
jgi:hypothetical protein